VVEVLASLLPQAPAVPQQAKDVSRAACLPLLAVDDGEVAKDVKIAEELAGAARAPRRAPVCRSRTELLSGRPVAPARAAITSSRQPSAARKLDRGFDL
jgi:hypothetical protein